MTVETQPIQYFEISGCKNNEPIDDKVFLKKIAEHLNLSNIITYDNENKIDLTNSVKEFLQDDIYYYNDRGSYIKCVNEYPVKFTIKNISLNHIIDIIVPLWCKVIII